MTKAQTVRAAAVTAVRRRCNVIGVILGAALAAASFAPNVQAGGDLAPVPPSFSWQGFYAGMQAGYAWGESSDVPWGVPNGPLVNNDGPADLSGPFAGIHVGYNFQRDRFVFGVEGDLELTALEGNDEDRGGNINGIRGNWQASLRARAGVLVGPRSLFYLTGGFAWLDADGTISDVPAIQTASHFFTGWTIGGGVEHVIGPKATLRLEYRYTEFDLDVAAYRLTGGARVYDLGFEPEIHSVRLGFSIKLP